MTMTFLSRHRRELGVLGAYAVLLLAIALARPDVVGRQVLNSWLAAAPLLVVAVGMTLIIIARQIDISVGSQVSVCAVAMALAVKAGVAVPVAVLLAIACGVVFGAINGVLVAAVRLPAIVVTLGTMVILREALAWVRGGEAVLGLPANFQWLGLSQSAGEVLVLAVAASVFGVAAWATRYLAAARAAYAVGSDAEAARLAGIRPVRVVFGQFVLTGALCGLAAALSAIMQPQVPTDLGKNAEMLVIAGVVVGGTAVTGGRGTLAGTLAGILLLAAVRPALSLLEPWTHINADWEKAAYGLVILLAVAMDAPRGRRSALAAA
jgi:rhamnose transport system permease protein